MPECWNIKQIMFHSMHYSHRQYFLFVHSINGYEVSGLRRNRNHSKESKIQSWNRDMDL